MSHGSSPQHEVGIASARAQLEADGLIVSGGDACRTTRRWQRAMAHAAATLFQEGDTGDDLRVPIAMALCEVYPSGVGDERLAELVEAMLPIEVVSLGLSPA